MKDTSSLRRPSNCGISPAPRHGPPVCRLTIDRDELRGQLGLAPVERLGRPRDDLGQDLERVARGVRLVARQHEVQDGSQGIDVGARVHGAALGLLRSHVGRRTHDAALHGEGVRAARERHHRSRAVVRLGQVLGQSPVDDDGLAELADQHVLGLEIDRLHRQRLPRAPGRGQGP